MSTPKEIINRKAKFEYHFVQEFEAGIALTGTEVKALRQGNANLTDAYCLFDGKFLILKSMYIGDYKEGNLYNHEHRRDRILLLRKPELKKIERRMTEKGMTVVPYKAYFSPRGFVKLQIVLAQGKKEFDKRETIKERDNKREIDRIKKIYK
ncbi:MAG: SsrA-binding protein SmpB [Saprospiraceae bacterium]|jgi:SsrA-binding protein|nr:SsrA-binding protein SmpB [Saprospiraceae bacterium]MBK8632558.1 SsrA-binding protein SmpB [Saprospiraceae bacterium]HMS67148.1 SsrA-binding protein SmpB [Saprospiraceae bacterium]HPN68141.1 SsrA-binding protein SmpB [Saprospiraceae bacterium]